MITEQSTPTELPDTELEITELVSGNVVVEIEVEHPTESEPTPELDPNTEATELATATDPAASPQKPLQITDFPFPELEKPSKAQAHTPPAKRSAGGVGVADDSTIVSEPTYNAGVGTRQPEHAKSQFGSSATPTPGSHAAHAHYLEQTISRRRPS